MKTKFIKIVLIPLVIVILLGASVFVFRHPSQALGQIENLKLFLPLADRNYPYLSVFGADIDNITNSNGLSQMATAGDQWTRPWLSWSDIEPTEGNIVWANATNLETQLKNAAANNIQVILVLEDTPSWALKSGYSCGAVASDKFSALGDFASSMVSRYSQPPYNIHYYELWNEPDVVGSLGCWGDANDPYYGGSYYGEMLKAVYPRIKAANAYAQVLVGGLLLDCDPRTTTACSSSQAASSLFLEGILVDGAGNYFDGVSFHAYDHYQGKAGEYYNPNWNSSWNGATPNTNIGPVFQAKAGYIRSLLQQYNEPGKFLINSELALIYLPFGSPGCNAPLDQDLENTKAAYLVESYALTMVNGLKAGVWYSTMGWRGSCLLDASLIPQTAYYAFSTTIAELNTSSYLQPIPATLTGVTGYEFTRGKQTIWVIWSKDGTPQSVSLPETPSAVWSMTGGSLTASQVLNNVNWQPIFIEFPP